MNENCTLVGNSTIMMKQYINEYKQLGLEKYNLEETISEQALMKADMKKKFTKTQPLLEYMEILQGHKK